MANQDEKPKSGRQRAVALRYAEGDRAPKVVAAGAGEIAKRILELAREHDVPIRQDDTLVDILSKLDIGYEIPAETYRAVAEILAFLYRTDAEWREKKRESHSLFAAQPVAPPAPDADEG
ncbi:MAG: EscU/YscU/HrcU family type III secretion system export apparatus switch protein [Bdellovibrionales bacterium]|nr:EscU/YscU/HrcU family type III secretion system export apparatus switch protein [Bdellovibrionales bacterium]